MEVRIENKNNKNSIFYLRQSWFDIPAILPGKLWDYRWLTLIKLFNPLENIFLIFRWSYVSHYYQNFHSYNPPSSQFGLFFYHN